MAVKIAQFLQCDARNYLKGREGCDVEKVIVHYSGGKGSAYENLLYFSREDTGSTSAHYFIGKKGDIRQSVKECDTAWHCGYRPMNLRSIGIEVCSNGEPFTEAQIESLGKLVRDIMKRYRLKATDVIRHYDVTGKHCPVQYVDDAKWKKLRKRITGGAKTGSKSSGAKKTRTKAKKAPGAKPSGESARIDKLAMAVIDGKYGNGETRKKKLGRDYAAVQKRVNELLG